jgi:hypothetical protein
MVGLLCKDSRWSSFGPIPNRDAGRVLRKPPGVHCGFCHRGGICTSERNCPWGPVVGSISSEQSVLGGSLSGEGWWNGAAWIDLEVQDYRGPKLVTFTLPIVAEQRESNMWGYASGDRAAKAAWNQVGTQLTRAMDAIARAVRDQEP